VNATAQKLELEIKFSTTILTRSDSFALLILLAATCGDVSNSNFCTVDACHKAEFTVLSKQKGKDYVNSTK